MRIASSWETEVTAWLMTLRSPALAIRRSLWQEAQTNRFTDGTQCSSSGTKQICVTANRQKTVVKKVLLFCRFPCPLIPTVKNLEKSSWERKRRSASCRMSAGRLHSWVWRSFMEASPLSTVRNCPNMLALHTKSFSCNWAPARVTWMGQNVCPTVTLNSVGLWDT